LSSQVITNDFTQTNYSRFCDKTGPLAIYVESRLIENHKKMHRLNN
jgi:hypothetical protein